MKIPIIIPKIIIPSTIINEITPLPGASSSIVNIASKGIQDTVQFTCRKPPKERLIHIKDLIKLDYDIKILCTVNELSMSLKEVLNKDLNNLKILLVIGPEGGFTDSEEKILIDNGFISTTFGRRVLRTETASLYALSIINYILM